MKWANSKGYNCSVEFSRKPGRIADSIISRAKDIDSDMIAIGTHSGQIASALVGNIAREVIRSSKIPIWVSKYDDA